MFKGSILVLTVILIVLLQGCAFTDSLVKEFGNTGTKLVVAEGSSRGFNKLADTRKIKATTASNSQKDMMRLIEGLSKDKQAELIPQVLKTQEVLAKENTLKGVLMSGVIYTIMLFMFVIIWYLLNWWKPVAKKRTSEY